MTTYLTSENARAALEVELRERMAPLLAEGGATAAFARMMLVVLPVWGRACDAEMDAATGQVRELVPLVFCNVLSNLITSTFAGCDRSQFNDALAKICDMARRAKANESAQLTADVVSPGHA